MAVFASGWYNSLYGTRRFFCAIPTTIRALTIRRCTLEPLCNTLSRRHHSIAGRRTLWTRSRISRQNLWNGRVNCSTTPKQGYTQRVKVIFKEYGPVGLVFHTAMSLTSLGTCYVLVDSGLDVVKILNYFNVKMESSISKGASTFAIAYVLHKALLPLRATITIVSVPMIVRALRARGWMKNPVGKIKSSVQKLKK